MSVPDPIQERILGASPDAVLLVDDQGRIVRAWGATVEVFGYEAAELVGVSVEQLVPEGERRGHVEQRARFTGQGMRRPMGSGLTVDGLRKDGTKVPLDVKLTPVEVDGRRHVAAFARDVAHLAQAQRELIERTQQLELLDREKNRILGVAAHDLRNPLSALRGFTDLLEGGIFGDIEVKAGLGWALLKLGLADEAVAQFREVLAVAPRHAAASEGFLAQSR